MLRGREKNIDAAKSDYDNSAFYPIRNGRSARLIITYRVRRCYLFHSFDK